MNFRLEGQEELEIDIRNHIKCCVLYYLISKERRAKFIKDSINVFRKCTSGDSMTVCILRKQAYELFSSHNFFRKKNPNQNQIDFSARIYSISKKRNI